MTELEDGEVTKALGQFERALTGVMSPLCLYGQTDYVAQAIREITRLAWQLHWRLEGVDEPYEIEIPHW